VTKGRRRGKNIKITEETNKRAKTLFFSPAIFLPGHWHVRAVIGGRRSGGVREQRVKSWQLSVQVYAIIVAHHEPVMCVAGWWCH